MQRGQGPCVAGTVMCTSLLAARKGTGNTEKGVWLVSGSCHNKALQWHSFCTRPPQLRVDHDSCCSYDRDQRSSVSGFARLPVGIDSTVRRIAALVADRPSGMHHECSLDKRSCFAVHCSHSVACHPAER